MKDKKGGSNQYRVSSKIRVLDWLPLSQTHTQQPQRARTPCARTKASADGSSSSTTKSTAPFALRPPPSPPPETGSTESASAKALYAAESSAPSLPRVTPPLMAAALSLTGAAPSAGRTAGRVNATAHWCLTHAVLLTRRGLGVRVVCEFLHFLPLCLKLERCTSLATLSTIALTGEGASIG